MAADGAGICGQAKAVGALLGSTWGHGPRLNDVSPVFKTLDAWICLGCGKCGKQAGMLLWVI